MKVNGQVASETLTQKDRPANVTYSLADRRDQIPMDLHRSLYTPARNRSKKGVQRNNRYYTASCPERPRGVTATSMRGAFESGFVGPIRKTARLLQGRQKHHANKPAVRRFPHGGMSSLESWLRGTLGDESTPRPLDGTPATSARRVAHVPCSNDQNAPPPRR